MPTTRSSYLCTLALGLSLSAGLAACGLDEPEVGTSSAAAGGGGTDGCKPWGCGDNSPTLGLQTNFYELSKWGKARPNPDGLFIAGFSKAGVSYQIDVVGTNLVGRDPAGAIAIDHAALTGAVLEVRSIHDEAVWYDLEVKQVSATGAWYWQGPQTPVETLRIEYGGHGQARENPLCDTPSTTTIGQQGLPLMNIVDVVVFGSERYDATTKQVVATGPATSGWINFGCAGGVLAKLLLNRHVPVAHTVGFETTRPARQAMLKMFSADYCGTGWSFTHTGEPLAWRDAAGWVPSFPLAIANHESWWDSDGALCLDTPRLETTTTPYDGGLAGDLAADLAQACGGTAPPPCSTLSAWPNAFGAALFISANPVGS